MGQHSSMGLWRGHKMYRWKSLVATILAQWFKEGFQEEELHLEQGFESGCHKTMQVVPHFPSTSRTSVTIESLIFSWVIPHSNTCEWRLQFFRMLLATIATIIPFPVRTSFHSATFYPLLFNCGICFPTQEARLDLWFALVSTMQWKWHRANSEPRPPEALHTSI